MRIALGSDERTALTEAIASWLDAEGHQVTVVADGTSWPQVGARVGAAVRDREAEVGIVCCTTGTGVSIAANKVEGVRAALCTDAETARGARRWNDANVLAFGLRLTTEAVAKEMVSVFLETSFDPDEAELVDSLEPPHR
jgi:ribose 5-phosphate isomerase B